MSELCETLPIPLPAKVVVAIRSYLFFRDDLGGGRDGQDGLDGRFGAEGFEVGFQLGLNLGEVVLFDGAALGPEAKAIVLDFEEGDGVAPPGEGFVEDENGGFHPGVGIETA